MNHIAYLFYITNRCQDILDLRYQSAVWFNMTSIVIFIQLKSRFGIHKYLLKWFSKSKSFCNLVHIEDMKFNWYIYSNSRHSSIKASSPPRKKKTRKGYKYSICPSRLTTMGRIAYLMANSLVVLLIIFSHSSTCHGSGTFPCFEARSFFFLELSPIAFHISILCR